MTGAYSPSDELPGRLQMPAKALPQTYAIDAARRLLLDFDDAPILATIGGLSPLVTDLVLLAGFELLLPVVGGWLFVVGIRKAQNDGGLSRWA